MKFPHGLEHTENSPHASQRHRETGEFRLASVPPDVKLASVPSPVALATGF